MISRMMGKALLVFCVMEYGWHIEDIGNDDCHHAMKPKYRGNLFSPHPPSQDVENSTFCFLISHVPFLLLIIPFHPIYPQCVSNKPLQQEFMTRSPKRSQEEDDGGSRGRWTTEEHNLFEEGLRKYGKQWKRIALEIPTRTVVQIRTHAQKFFQKLAKVDPGTSTSIALKPPNPPSSATITRKVSLCVCYHSLSCPIVGP